MKFELQRKTLADYVQSEAQKAGIEIEYTVDADSRLCVRVLTAGVTAQQILDWWAQQPDVVRQQWELVI